MVSQLSEALALKESELLRLQAQWEDQLLRAQSECEFTRELLVKAQDVIKRLSQDSYLDTGRLSFRNSEEEMMVEQRLRAEYEGRFVDVQRKGEQIIAYYKNELRRVHTQLD